MIFAQHLVGSNCPHATRSGMPRLHRRAIERVKADAVIAVACTTLTASRAADAGDAIEESQYCRLLGTPGSHAAIGQAVKSENGMVCWKLHPSMSGYGRK